MTDKQKPPAELIVVALPILVVPALVYLACAFVAWEINPGEWHELLRMLAVFAAGLIGVAVAEFRSLSK